MPLNLSQRFTGVTSVANAYTGTAAAFLPAASVLSIYATYDAGSTGDVVSIGLTLNQGGTAQQPIPPGYNIGQAEGAAQGPVIPDDVVLAQYGVPASSSLILAVALTATTDVARIKTFITP
ncbi:MAG: hypothetical protein ACHP7H_01295 [Hyphomicrobiales bacterium]